MKALGIGLLVALLVWVIGFAWFVQIAGRAGQVPPHSDGIVAFTGGADRVETALRLLAEQRGDKLLLSGIGGGAELAELAPRAGVDPLPLASRVTLGRSATTTRGNAQETAAWARANEIHSLLVVTAAYHMPRALAELSSRVTGRGAVPASCPAAGTHGISRRAAAADRRGIRQVPGHPGRPHRGDPATRSPCAARRPRRMSLLRSLLFNVFFFAATFVLTLFGTAVRLIARHRALDVARLWAHVVVGGLRVICGVHVQIIGRERLRRAGPMLIASAHQSAFDTIVWLVLVPRCCYVLKQELLRIPLFGPLVQSTGMIAVDRSGGASAMRGLMREAERAVREDRQIVIFPEGTRAEAGSLLPLQPGVAALAARTGLPVTPVVTDSGFCWGRRAFRKRPGTIHIHVLEPIPTGFRRDELMRRLKSALRTEVYPTGDPVENSVG